MKLAIVVTKDRSTAGDPAKLKLIDLESGEAIDGVKAIEIVQDARETFPSARITLANPCVIPTDR